MVLGRLPPQDRSVVRQVHSNNMVVQASCSFDVGTTSPISPGPGCGSRWPSPLPRPIPTSLRALLHICISCTCRREPSPLLLGVRCPSTSSSPLPGLASREEAILLVGTSPSARPDKDAGNSYRLVLRHAAILAPPTAVPSTCMSTSAWVLWALFIFHGAEGAVLMGREGRTGERPNCRS